MSDFVDLSSAQKGADLRAYARAGYDLVVIKATEGTGYLNPSFSDWAATAETEGLRIGAYHFADPGADHAAEAHYFLNAVGSRSVFPVLDAENAGAGTQWAPGEPQRCIDTWTSIVEPALGPGWVYTGFAFHQEQQLRLPPGWAWWIADYGVSAPPLVPGLGAWQFTDAATVPGIPGLCDCSHLYQLPGRPSEDPEMKPFIVSQHGQPTLLVIPGLKPIQLATPEDVSAWEHVGAIVVPCSPTTYQGFANQR